MIVVKTAQMPRVLAGGEGVTEMGTSGCRHGVHLNVQLHSVKSRTGLDLEAVGVIERDETGLVQRVTMTFSPLDAAVSLSAELGGIVGEEFGDDLFYDASMNEIAAS